MAKLTLTDIAAGYALTTTVNANNALIEAALENTLSRDGTTPNTMSASLDMNSQQITNLPTPTADAHAASKGYVDTQVTAVSTASGSFSEALSYSFTNQIDFQGNSLGVRILDTAGTNGFNAYMNTHGWLEAVGTVVDFNIQGFSGSVDIHDGIGTKWYDSDNDAFVSAAHDGTDFNITKGGATGSVNIKGGMDFRIYETAGTDYGEFQHNGTDLQIFTSDAPTGAVEFAGTDVRVTSERFLVLEGTTGAEWTKLATGSTGGLNVTHSGSLGNHFQNFIGITDGISAPGAAVGFARLYVDSGDGDLKVVFGDGTVKTIATDT